MNHVCCTKSETDQSTLKGKIMNIVYCWSNDGLFAVSTVRTFSLDDIENIEFCQTILAARREFRVIDQNGGRLLGQPMKAC